MNLKCLCAGLNYMLAQLGMGMLTFQVSRAVGNAFWDRQEANKVSSVVRCFKYSYISRI